MLDAFRGNTDEVLYLSRFKLYHVASSMILANSRLMTILDSLFAVSFAHSID